VDSQAIEARFAVMVSGCVAEAKSAAVHAVLALDEAHGHLVNARIVAVPPPSERWYRLLDQFESKVEAPESTPVGEHADRFARGLFVAAAAFLAAEANDLEDRISLLTGGHRQEEVRARLGYIADKVGEAADVLIGRIEDGTWQEFGQNVPSVRVGAVPVAKRLSGGLDPSHLDETRQPTRPRYMQAVGRTAWPAAAGSAGVMVTFFGDNLWRNAPQSIMIIVVAVLLVCLGMLLGSNLHTKSIDRQYRHIAQRVRRFNEQEAAMDRRGYPAAVCDHCSLEINRGTLLSERPPPLDEDRVRWEYVN